MVHIQILLKQLQLIVQQDLILQDTIFIGNEQITYTGTSSTTFTGCTRGANDTTAASIASGVHSSTI